MNPWGFALPATRELDYDAANTKAWQHILQSEPSLGQCITCGQCAAACTRQSKRFAGMRLLILCLARGEHQQAADLGMECQLCGKCSLVCPRGVHLRKVCLEVKKYFNPQEYGI